MLECIAHETLGNCVEMLGISEHSRLCIPRSGILPRRGDISIPWNTSSTRSDITPSGKLCLFFHESLIFTLGNCVTAARQTLTLFVGVRIPIPQPKESDHHPMVAFIFLLVWGIEDSHHSAEGAGLAFAARGSVAKQQSKTGCRGRQPLRSGRERANPRHNFPQSLAISTILCYTSHRKAVEI